MDARNSVLTRFEKNFENIILKYVGSKLYLRIIIIDNTLNLDDVLNDGHSRRLSPGVLTQSIKTISSIILMARSECLTDIKI